MASVGVIGGGPAGLTAAYLLAESGAAVRVLEADSALGGLSQTVEYRGYRFDIGGHRFYTTSEDVAKLWDIFLPEAGDRLHKTRKSRIFYDGKYFDYPLDPVDALRKLGFSESLKCFGSYVAAVPRRLRAQRTFEEWVSARFGQRLYQRFFGTYTEKVWGKPGSDVSADWAAQRIGKLTGLGAVIGSLFPSRAPRTLTPDFMYPRLGPGMMWENVGRMVQDLGNDVELGSRVLSVEHSGGAARSVTVDCDGGRTTYAVDSLVSSMPLGDLVRALRPVPPPDVVGAAERLQHRSFLTVAVMLKGRPSFDDHWLYIHSPNVMVGRIQNYLAWSSDLVPAEDSYCLGLEYFCDPDDELWCTSDADLGEQAVRELATLNIVTDDAVEDHHVVRMRNAYPVYSQNYEEDLDLIRQYLASVVSNVYCVGRNGQHRYNNQDHSMLTGILAARSIISGRELDIWDVNTGSKYLEQRSLAV